MWGGLGRASTRHGGCQERSCAPCCALRCTGVLCANEAAAVRHSMHCTTAAGSFQQAPRTTRHLHRPPRPTSFHPALLHPALLQTVLSEIAVMAKNGPYKGQWELKKEYRAGGQALPEEGQQ